MISNENKEKLNFNFSLTFKVVRQHEVMVAAVEDLKKNIAGNLHGCQNIAADIKSIFDIWFPEITKLVNTINQHFGDFMDSMNYVGEIQLIKQNEVCYKHTY